MRIYLLRCDQNSILALGHIQNWVQHYWWCSSCSALWVHISRAREHCPPSIPWIHHQGPQRSHWPVTIIGRGVILTYLWYKTLTSRPGRLRPRYSENLKPVSWGRRIQVSVVTAMNDGAWIMVLRIIRMRSMMYCSMALRTLTFVVRPSVYYGIQNVPWTTSLRLSNGAKLHVMHTQLGINWYLLVSLSICMLLEWLYTLSCSSYYICCTLVCNNTTIQNKYNFYWYLYLHVV